MPEKTIFLILKYSFGIVLSFLLLFSSFHYLSSDYYSFIFDILTSLRRINQLEDILNNLPLLWIYKTGKYLIVLLIPLFSYWAYDFFWSNKSRLSHWTNQQLIKLTNVLSGNIAYVNQLPGFTKRNLLVIFILQCTFFLFLLFRIPFHYDESWTYMYFSGKGLLQTAIFYPLPNNHILYNLVAALFVKLPLDPQIGTRLPSYFCSFIATWYFFKLSNTYFPRSTTIIITALFASSYPFILYSVEARGYSFLICFTILLFYAANHLARDVVNTKYRHLYFFSLVAGLYSIPSFLYAAFAISSTLALYFMIKKQWRRLTFLMLDNFKAALAVIILYAPIIYFNGIDKLTKPNGFIRIQTADLTKSIIPLLSSALELLTGTKNVPLTGLILLIPAAILFHLIHKGKSKFLTVLCVIMLVSPIFILFLNPVIPFPRVWVYLIVPLTLATGYLISVLVYYFKTIVKKKNVLTGLAKQYDRLATAAVVLIVMLCYANFQNKHAKQYAIDYSIRSTFEKMGHDINHIETIGYTNRSMEYYVAEDLQFQCIKRNPHKALKMDNKDILTRTEDVLILAPDSVENFQLSQYEFIGTDNVNYSLFFRKIP